MTRPGLEAAIDAASRFLSLATEAQKYEEFIVGTKRTGELRRASLDLTRRLAEMRKP